MNEAIYTIRKNGAAVAGNKEQAAEIVAAAAKQGYTFKARKQGWNWIVQDMDN